MSEAQPRTWRGVIAVEDRPSIDGRILERGSLSWEALPLPLATPQGDDMLIIGWVDSITRDGDLLRATGRIGDVEKVGAEILEAIKVGTPLIPFVVPEEIRQGTVGGIQRLTKGRVYYAYVLTDGTESAWPETIIDGVRA